MPGQQSPFSVFFTFIMIIIVVVGDNVDTNHRRRSDDSSSKEILVLLQTQAQDIATLKAETAALKNQLTASTAKLDKCSQTAFFTAHVSHATPAYGEAVLFDVIQADSANAYDVTHRAYVIPVTGIYWVSVVVDVLHDASRATLELYADSQLLGSADGASVSEGLYNGAFRFSQGQKLVVRRGHDAYASGNALYKRTVFSVVLVHAL